MIYAFGRLWLQRPFPPVLTYSNLLLICYQSVVFQIDKAFHASLPKVHIRIFFGLQQNVYHWKICAVSKMSWISQLQKPWMQVIEKCTAKPIPGGNEEIRWKRRFLHSFSPWKVLTPQKCWITKKKYFSKSLLLKPNYRWKIKTERDSTCLKGGQLVGQLSDQTNATKANPPPNFAHKQIFENI